MKACLLICDHVAADLTPIHGAYPEMFRRMLPELEIDAYFVCDGLFPEVKDFDIFICSGSKYSVYDPEDWIYGLGSLINEIEDFNKKLVGICFGHQMIAHALGGRVEKSSNGWQLGVHTFEVLKEKSWMEPQQEEFNVLMLCQDQVTKLPPGAEVIAETPACPVGMFQVGSSILGIQGHPEYTKSYNRALYNSRADRIEAEKIAIADKSMSMNLDQQLIASWIMNFLKY